MYRVSAHPIFSRYRLSAHPRYAHGFSWDWLKASLPSSRGGLNLRRASLQAPTAYISSLSQTRDLVAGILGGVSEPPEHLPDSIAALALAAGRPEWTSLDEIDVPLRQRPLSHSIDEAIFDHLATTTNVRHRALVLSTSLPHAGDWLSVVPSPALGLHLQDKEFRLCLDYWLGLRLFEDGSICPICQVAADPFGDHQVGCGGNGDRIHRYDSIRDALFSAVQSAALAPRREVPSLIPGSSSRPADIYLPNWDRGRPAALDVTVISTMQQQTQAGAANTPGHALRVGEERKMVAHADACRSVGVREPSTPSPALAAFKVNVWASLPLTVLGTSSSTCPSLCGKGTLPSGSAVSQPVLPWWTELFDTFFFLWVCVCVCLNPFFMYQVLLTYIIFWFLHPFFLFLFSHYPCIFGCGWCSCTV